MIESNELSFEEQRKKLSHVAQNDSKYLIRLKSDDIETIDYVYESFLNQISDQTARKEAEEKIKITISEIMREEAVRNRAELPSKEKRDQKQRAVIKAIDTALDSLNTWANEIYDLEESGYSQKFFEFDPQGIEIINYIRSLKTHRNQIEKLIKGEIQRDEIFHSKDYLKRPQVTKTRLKKLLQKLIEKHELKVSSTELEEILHNTPPIRSAKKSKSTDSESKTDL